MRFLLTLYLQYDADPSKAWTPPPDCPSVSGLTQQENNKLCLMILPEAKEMGKFMI